jgi:predicted RecB family nuclease
MKAHWHTCSRGHRFKKSSDCPVCPTCWAGYYKKENQGDFPDTISAPALRALLNAGITSLAKLAKHTEDEILEFHGMGPASVPQLRAALKRKGLAFKKN